MNRKKLGVVLGLVLLLGATTAPALGGTAYSPLRADLDGRPIKLADVGRWFCHDFDHPQLHCYSSATDLEQAVTDRSLPSESGGFTALAAHGPNDYVTIYSEPSYAGSYAHLSANYDQLFLIGWNDRISSFKARNSQAGKFYSNWFGSGTVRSFCCNTNVAWMTSTYDNTFSSVYRS
jgi:hypothetical protein